MTKTIIKLIDVYKIYKMGEVEVNALRGVNIEVEEGEFLAIMGPSGSGKSTCVNMVGCLDVPSKGKIFLDHKNIALLAESELFGAAGRTVQHRKQNRLLTTGV